MSIRGIVLYHICGHRKEENSILIYLCVYLCVCSTLFQESGYYISKWPLAKTYFFTFFSLHVASFMPLSVCAGYYF